MAERPTQFAERPARADSKSRSLSLASELATRFQQAFGVEPTVFSGNSGEVLHLAAQHRGCDLDSWGVLCRAASTRREPEFIAEREPLAALATPGFSDDGPEAVAVGVFLTQCPGGKKQIHQIARWFDISPAQAETWVSQQEVWSTATLLRTARLVASLGDARREASLVAENLESVSANLSATYEEISLLNRLSHRLRLSCRDEELAQLAAAWLLDALPAQSIVLQLAPSPNAKSSAYRARTEPVLIVAGKQALEAAEFDRLLAGVNVKTASFPVVKNPGVSSSGMEDFPAVRQLVLVSITEGANHFGYLAAVNHVDDAEFGSVEAGLLGSVGAILGIHFGNRELYRQQKEFLAGVVRALTSAIDAKDPYTCGHSDRVARVAVRLAQELGYTTEQVNLMYLSGLLHDVGKIGIDDNVLRKPGRLTEAEYEHIKTHAEIGYRILSDLNQISDVLPAVLHHHEQWDGKGYPRQLAGDDIPECARIVAVADSFDAMGSDRPYRKGMPEEKMDAILRDGAGKQWDPRVIEAYFRVRDDLRQIAKRDRREKGIDLEQWS